MRARTLFSIAILGLPLLALAACDRGDEPPTPTPGQEDVAEPGDEGGPGGRPLAAEAEPGIDLRLSDADPAAAGDDAEGGPPTAEGEPLDEARVAELLARLPALPEEAAEAVDVNLPPGPPPPAVAGDTIPVAFPAEAEAAPPPGRDEPLAVVRVQPEGDLRLASHLSVTFNRPFVPLAANAELDAMETPVRLSPEPPGRWRWVGTQTLLFEPEGGRFPMATAYEAEVPAGVEAADGATLGEGRAWSFRTPPASLVERRPWSDMPVDREPLIVLVFDQQIAPEAVLPTITARADGEEVALRLATQAEVEADEEAARLLGRPEHEGRGIALRPEAPLPLAAELSVTVGEGVPSAEGPRVSEESERFTLQVYEPLAVRELGCDTEREPIVPFGRDTRATGCLPFSPWYVFFNNPLDPASIDPADVLVEPALDGRRVEIMSDAISISGLSQGRTDYEVTLPAGLTDVFGQSLNEPLTLRFETGDLPPILSGPQRDMIVLDPTGPPALGLTVVNQDALDVALYRVTPADWPAYQDFAGRWRWDEDPPAPPGELAQEARIEVDAERDAFARVAVDLAPALSDEGRGQVLVLVTPKGWDPEEPDYASRPVAVWAQATEIGLDLLRDAERSLVWATALEDGRPLAGVEIALSSGDELGETDAEGLVRGPAFAASDDRGLLLLARRGEDLAFLPDLWGGAEPLGTSLRWQVFDDRGLYRPGETAYVKGYLRGYGEGVGGDVERLPVEEGEVAWRLMAANGEDVAEGVFPLGAFGSFAGEVELPAGMAVGPAQLYLSPPAAVPDQGGTSIALNVAEFRRPEFEVRVAAEQPDALRGEEAVMTVSAAYFAGGALPGADVSWRVSARPTVWAPPGWPEFQFGTWTPWWGPGPGPGPMPAARMDAAMYYEDEIWPPVQEAAIETYEARTDAGGEHRLAVEVARIAPPGPVSLEAEATVMDVNRQALSGRAPLLVHPAALYAGLRLESRVAEPGEEVRLEAIVTDLEGEPVAGRVVEVVAERLEGVWREGRWEEEALPAGGCEIRPGDAPADCALSFEEGGEYRLRARVQDDAGRPNQSELTLWVSGAPAPPAGGSLLEEGAVTLVPDQDEYRPGDTARILVQAPFAPAEALVTLRRSGLVEERRLRLEEGSTTLEVPIEAGHVPNLTVAVELVGAAVPPSGASDDEGDAEDGDPAGAAAPSPAYAAGAIDLPVPPYDRTFEVLVEPAAPAARPGETADVAITVRDETGAPVPGAEVALLAVDEAVLSLTGHRIPDPIAAFYAPRPAGVDTRRSRSALLRDEALSALADGADGRALDGAAGEMVPAAMADVAMESMAMDEAEGDMADDASMLQRAAPPAPMAAGRGGVGGGNAAAAPPVAERVDLNPVAAFSPTLLTDESGRVEARIALPDNVTRYRLSALATDGGPRFGTGEAGLRAELPLVLRPSAPRFLNYGDTFELPLVIQSRADEDREVDVVARAANLDLRGPAGLRVTVPAGDRVEVRLPAAAARPGRAAIQAAAFAVDDEATADAQRVTLPVYTPATTEAFATYGTLDEGALAQPVRRPEDVLPGYGELSVTASSTALSELTDAFLYLDRYPYEGAEQVASRLLATLALRDVLAAFAAEGLPSEAEVAASIAADVDRLQELQRPDGGWRYWPALARPSQPFASLHAAHALVRAAADGQAVDAGARERALQYLRDIGRHIDEQEADWSEPARRTAEAYALYVRMLAGEPDGPRAAALLAESGDDAQPDLLGWLLSVSAEAGDDETAEEILRRMNNLVAETASTAQLTTSYDESGAALVLASDRRADAIALEGWMRQAPDADLIPKLVRGLLDGRREGRWSSTQENAWALLALNEYFRRYEAEEPAFRARAWLGETFAGEASFQGRDPDRREIALPLELVPEGETDLTLAKEGPGRLYYRLGMTYAPEDLALEPDERGFSVERAYEAVDDPADVRRRADGAWEIRAGSRVRVRLAMVAPGRRYHVALVDPLPAGLEALNPDLVTSAAPPPDPAADEEATYPYRWGRWYDHAGFRDQRVELFADTVWGDVLTFDYIARATTPGEFVVPPAKAEEMYHPETYGRGGTDRVIVVP